MKHFLVAAVLFALANCYASTFLFSDTSYSSGIPEGWAVDNNYSNRYKPYLNTRQPALYGGESALQIVFSSANRGSEMLFTKKDPITDDVACDNLVFSVTVYVEPKGGSVTDSVQPVISIDGGSFVALGDAISFKSESVQEPAWVTYNYSTNIIDAASKVVKIGLKAIAGGNSTSSGYVKSLSVDYKVCTTVQKIELISDGCVLDTLDLNPNISNLLVRAKIEESPVDDNLVKILADQVTAELMFHSDSLQIELTKHDDGFWYSEPLPQLDAGIDGVLRVSVPYFSPAGVETLAPTNEAGVAITVSDAKRFQVGKLGSVWINEITGYAIEFCGTTNRTYLGGWQVSISNHLSGVISKIVNVPFDDFNYEFNKTIQKTRGVVGIASITDLDFGQLEYPSTFRLINSSGVIEDEVVLTNAPNLSWSRVNYAPWNDEYKFSYDWTGTSQSEVFDWVNVEVDSIGDVNTNQGFRTEENKTIKVCSLPYANITVKVNDFLNLKTSEGDVEKSELAGSDGAAVFNLLGWTHYITNFYASISSTAFGWMSENGEIISIPRDNETNEYTVVMKPITAVESFRDELSKSWENNTGKTLFDTSGREIVWKSKKDNTVGGYLSLYTSSAYSAGHRELKCVNTLSPCSNRVLNISFETKNQGLNFADGRKDELTIVIGTNSTWSGEIVSSSPVSDKNPNFSDGIWYLWSNQVVMPEEFANASELWVKLRGVSEGATSSELVIKNLRIAFQDMVTVEGLRRTGTETAPHFEIDVKPWCGEGQSVSNVTVQLVMDVNGTVFTNNAVVAGTDVSVTNLAEDTTFIVTPDIINATLEAGMGRALRAHDKFKCWAQVNYFADSRDPDTTKEWETRYFPDNSKVDSEGRWTVEGVYGVDMSKVESSSELTFEIPGGPISQNGDLAFRVYDEAGVSSVTVAISSGDSFAFTNDKYGVNDVDWFDVEVPATNLLANTTYSVLVSGVNGNGEAINETSFTFTTLANGATKAPVIEKVLNTVIVKADENHDPMADDGNPDDTEYAVYVRTGADSAIATTNNVEVWQTLGDWKTNSVTLESPAIDLYSTNYFSFITRNRENKVTEKENLIETNCCFNMTAKFVGEATQTANPFGNVQFALELIDPVQGEGEATVEIEYRKVGEQVWQTCVSYNLEFTTLAVTNSRTWDVWSVVQAQGVYKYDLRARVVSGARASEWAVMSDVEVDFVPPANPEIISNIGSVVGNKEFKFEVNAANYDEDVTFCWSVNDSAEVVGTSIANDKFAALAEGENNASVYAMDRLGNKSEKITKTWFVDTIKPTKPEITDVLKNGEYTRNDAFEFVAKADDATTLTYYWKLNNGEEQEAERFSGDVNKKEGSYTVEVYAKDAAGNVSDTQKFSWTYDITPPKGLVINGTPNANVVGDSAISLNASVDKSENGVVFAWNLNGNIIPGVSLSGVSKEGKNTATVTATDKAGNESSLTRCWTLDTENPTVPVITGSPAAGSVVNSKNFSLTATSQDATALTYHWKLSKGTSTITEKAGQTFEDVLPSDGAYTVAVYAKDEAGNKSNESKYTWTLDTVKPTVVLSSSTPNPFKAGDEFVVKATFSEPVTNFTSKSVSVDNGAVGSVEGAGAEYTFTIIPEAPVEGTIKVQVCVPGGVVADAAGNKNEGSNVLERECDTKKPTVTFASATPAVFNADKVSFVVTATFSEGVTGFAKNKVSVENGTLGDVQPVDGVDNTYSFLVTPIEEGRIALWLEENVVTDAAGNGNAASGKLERINDKTPPTELKIEGMPEDGASLNVKMFSFRAEAKDENSLTYHWKLIKETSTLNDDVIEQTFVGVLDEDGAYTVEVYAKDAAGNVSDSASRTWKLDRVAPEVTRLESDTPSRFNVEQMDVEVAFSEPVTNFTAASVSVANGRVDSVQEVQGKENTYKLTVIPEEKSGEDVVVTVQILEGVVADAAGNGNKASGKLSRTSDRTNPAVHLTSNTGNYFNGDLVVVATFSECVTDFDASSITVANASVEAVELLADNDKVYQITIKPVKEGEVSVLIEAGKVKDAAGNVNESSNKLSFIYDITSPEAPVITGEPGNGVSITSKAFRFEAKAEDATTLTYLWKLTKDGVEIQNGVTSDGTVFAGSVVEDGLYTVIVYAKDAAGNESEKSSCVWSLDTVAPTVEFVSELPSRFNAESSPVEMVVVFSEAVTNFTAASLNVVNGTVSEPEKVKDAENVNTYKFTLTPDADGEVSLSVPAGVVADAAGNKNEGSEVLIGVYDNTKPCVTISSNTPSPFNSSMTVEVVFSEVVTGFNNAALKIENGTIGSITAIENKENSYLVTIIPSKDGDVSVSVGADMVFDEAGNGNTASGTVKRIYDSTSPTVTLESETPDPFNGNYVFTVKAAFSEAVSDFTVDMITVNNGTVDAESIDVDGNVYTFVIKPNGDGEISVQIEGNKVKDLAGNGNVGSDILTRRCDVTKPTITFEGAEYFNEASLTVKVIFSEEVIDFTEKSVSVDNGVLNAVTGSGTTYELAITITDPSKDGVVTVTINEGVVSDAAGNGNVAAVFTSIYDITPPTKPTITGTPANSGELKTINEFHLVANTVEEGSGVDFYCWVVNGAPAFIWDRNYLTGEDLEEWGITLNEGMNEVYVQVIDKLGQYSEDSARNTFTFLNESVTSDVEFGGAVSVKVDADTGVTNAISFTSVQFSTNTKSTFNLKGFESKTANITDLQMWFVVADAPNGEKRKVKIDENATFDQGTKELTVTLPAQEVENKSSFFIFGVDNSEGMN